MPSAPTPEVVRRDRRKATEQLAHVEMWLLWRLPPARESSWPPALRAHAERRRIGQRPRAAATT
eukprot:775094-Pyramimonas_sp.AAC.1